MILITESNNNDPRLKELEHGIVGCLPPDYAIKWRAEFAEAFCPDVDYTGVLNKFINWLLRNQATHEMPFSYDVKTMVEFTIKTMDMKYETMAQKLLEIVKNEGKNNVKL